MTTANGTCIACGQPGKHFRRPTMGKFSHYTCDEGHSMAPTPRRNVAHVTTSRG